MATETARQADTVGYEDFGFGARRSERRYQSDNTEQLARALGWFSIGLGVAEIVAPGRLAQIIGVDNKPGVFRLMGLREIGHGIGIISLERPAGAVWSRVAGDILDLALLSTQLDPANSERRKTAAAAISVLGVTALDLFTARALSRESNGGRKAGAAVAPDRRGFGRGIRIKKAVTINHPVSEVYTFWRNFENLPRFMTHLESVKVLDDERRSHWVAIGPAGLRVEWDAELVEDRPNELISWRSLAGGNVDTAGYVRFRPAPGNRGTEIVVEMRYDPPGGVLGASIAKLFGESGEQVVARDLLAFKNVMEVGEVVHSDASLFHRPHSARPATDQEFEGRLPYSVRSIEQ
jgi:uncharacterized membrane protein